MGQKKGWERMEKLWRSLGQQKVWEPLQSARGERASGGLLLVARAGGLFLGFTRVSGPFAAVMPVSSTRSLGLRLSGGGQPPCQRRLPSCQRRLPLAAPRQHSLSTHHSHTLTGIRDWGLNWTFSYSRRLPLAAPPPPSSVAPLTLIKAEPFPPYVSLRQLWARRGAWSG
jgi:hypothetical protein